MFLIDNLKRDEARLLDNLEELVASEGTYHVQAEYEQHLDQLQSEIAAVRDRLRLAYNSQRVFFYTDMEPDDAICIAERLRFDGVQQAMIVVGKHDTNVKANLAYELAANYPCIKFTILEGEGTDEPFPITSERGFKFPRFTPEHMTEFNPTVIYLMKPLTDPMGRSSAPVYMYGGYNKRKTSPEKWDEYHDRLTGNWVYIESFYLVGQSNSVTQHSYLSRNTPLSSLIMRMITAWNNHMLYTCYQSLVNSVLPQFRTTIIVNSTMEWNADMFQDPRSAERDLKIVNNILNHRSQFVAADVLLPFAEKNNLLCRFNGTDINGYAIIDCCPSEHLLAPCIYYLNRL